MSPADQARADYLSAVLSFQGWASEHHDPQNPPPFWRNGATFSLWSISMRTTRFQRGNRTSALRR